MSPVSRGRKGKPKRKPRRGGAPDAGRYATNECDCPDCAGVGIEPTALLENLMDLGSALAVRTDAIPAEISGAATASLLANGGEILGEAFVQEMLGAIESRSGTGALAVLLPLAAVSGDTVTARAASEAAGRLVSAGVAAPAWADELSAPISVGDCRWMHHPGENVTILTAEFRRAGKGHAFLVSVDHDECGAASDIVLLPAEDLPAVLGNLVENCRGAGFETEIRALDPAEFHWYCRQAIGVRADHDEADPPAPELEDEEHEGPPYRVMAILLRTRLAALPEPREPADPVLVSRHAAAELAPVPQRAGSRRDRPAKLPAKRAKSAGPAPVYQLWVGLRGTEPPVWRRLLVPGDLSLARLHAVIQSAFGWDDSHLHAFETPYGDFGPADRESGTRAEAPVTLEQVAPRVEDTMVYRYDFGDDWEHEILVEAVLDPDPTLAHPRCTEGRRAAPPDDCGGIWGYEELLEALADPGHPEHEDRLEWLGLDDASQFDPDRCDLDEINRRLAARR